MLPLKTHERDFYPFLAVEGQHLPLNTNTQRVAITQFLLTGHDAVV